MAAKDDKQVNRAGFSTRAIHTGQEPDALTGAVMVPIYANSTYMQERPGEPGAHEYSRVSNPTRSALEECLADLENGAGSRAYASGMAAEATVLELLETGDHVLVSDDCYGGTRRLFEVIRRRSMGLEFSFVDVSDAGALAAALRPRTRMIWTESLTNPLMKVTDLGLVSEFARAHGLLSVCDNTFCSPALLRPLDFGIDLVLHSATKYLGGHSDMIAGVVTVADGRGDLLERLALLTYAVGGVLGPFESFLLLRSLKTLMVRMRSHSENGLRVARFLESHGGVERVYYPGLESHGGYEVARRQMEGFGGMMSVDLRGGMEGVRRFLGGLEVFTLAESLGGVESLVEHPATMTHKGLGAEVRREVGIGDGLVRLSVGIEDGDDLLRDLTAALSRL
ncbi:MAG: PLP-dependent aspartate aminotransferase family protein [Alphaproteobacteria bacterium]|nr:PLP-dependent aspartate aminotransferase family protein [Alphaproteobacteria bacterium]MDA8004604.1 PLP-dependent aspartate aminotransferase family protein [Alphaproteobacteria bacterium]MDA8006398.1 PLP-dependent aspartate aminotransferase family protein [Alphaproteobacteria bacterium]MDA8013417.1 PLP-dependent aspartate aminotransferase family protein [Alphaproteobacteria bacterium]